MYNKSYCYIIELTTHYLSDKGRTFCKLTADRQGWLRVFLFTDINLIIIIIIIIIMTRISQLHNGSKGLITDLLLNDRIISKPNEKPVHLQQY